jgi:hypothetical protein
MLDWLTKPNELLANKENPMISGLLDLVPHVHDRFGRVLTNQDPRTVGDYLANAGIIVQHVVGNALPLGLLADAKQAISGPDKGEALWRLAAEMSGAAQISHGFPGGPQAGVEFAARQRDLTINSQIGPQVRKAMQAGDASGAVDIIEKSDLSEYGKHQLLRSLKYSQAPPRDRRASQADWQSVNQAPPP